MSPAASGLVSPPGQQLLLQLSSKSSLANKAAALPVRLIFGLGIAQLLLGLLLLLLGLLVLLEGGWLTQLAGGLGCGSALLLSGALSVAMSRRAHHCRPLLAGFLTAVLVSFAGSCLLVVLSSARLVTDGGGGTASVYEVVDKVSSPPLELLGRSAAGLLDAALLVLSVFALLLMLLTLTASASGLCRGRGRRGPTPLGWRLALSDSAALLLSQVAWVSTPAVLQPTGAASSLSRLQQATGEQQATGTTSRERRSSTNQERHMASLARYSTAADAWREPSDQSHGPGDQQMTSERRHSYANQEHGMTQDRQQCSTNQRRRAMSLGRRHYSANQRREDHHGAASQAALWHGDRGSDHTKGRSRSRSRGRSQSRSRDQSRSRSHSRNRIQSQSQSRDQSRSRSQSRNHGQSQSRCQSRDRDQSQSRSRSQGLSGRHREKPCRESSRGHDFSDLTRDLGGRIGRTSLYVCRDRDLSEFERDLSDMERELSDLDREVEEQVVVINIQRSADSDSFSDSLHSRM